MAVFTLTTGIDTFSGSGNDVDYFVGIPITIDSVFYNGATGGQDTASGNGGDDQFHLGDGAGGTYDGGTETDTVFAYGNVSFFTTFTNFEIFNAAATGANIVGVAASKLNSFGTIAGVARDDGRIHLEVGIDANLDFGAKMDALDMGIWIFVDGSLSGTRTVEGTRHSDFIHIDTTSFSSVISYFGDDGADLFETDNDGGQAKLFGGAKSDTFAVFRNNSLFNNFTVIEGGEDAGDNDTVIASTCDFTAKVLGGVETLKGTLNVLTIAQARDIDNFISEDGAQPQLTLVDNSFTVHFEDFGGRADYGIGLDTSRVVGGGEFDLTYKADNWRGNAYAAETVNGGAQNDTFIVIWDSPDTKSDVIHADAGDDKIEIRSSLAAGESLVCTADGGADTDTLAAMGNITGIDIQKIEALQFLGKIEGGLALFASMLSYTNPTMDAGEDVEIVLKGGGGTLDMSVKSDTLQDGCGVELDGTDVTSALKLVMSDREDTVTGSAHNDTIKGGAGKDTVDGGAGKDTADYSDKTIKFTIVLDNGGGSAKVGTVVEDTLLGIENVIGGKAGDKIIGDAAGNTITGGKGNDTVKGAGGADKFVFNTKLGSANVDTVTDFKHGTDKLQLDDAIFKGIGFKLDAKEFYAASGASKAHDRDDRVIYDTKTGKLYIDDDGDKAGGHASVLFALLESKPVLSAGDVAII